MLLIEKSITVDALQISYIEAGAGPVMLFLHNSGGNWQIWQKQLHFFSRTHRVIALNWPSNGYSEEAKQDITLDYFTKLLSQFIELLQLDQIILFGNCIGASVAINYSQHYDKVDKLILFNICPGKRLVQNIVARTLLKIWERSLLARRLSNPLLHFLRNKTSWGKRFPDILFADPIDKKMPLYIEIDAHLQRLKNLKNRFNDLFALNSYSLERYCRGPLKVPAQLYWGKSNKVTPLSKDGYFFAEKFKIPLLPVEGGHLCMYESNEALNADILDFIAK